jgi:predicted ATPase
MITKVHARNYRSLGDVEVELGPLTVLVGPNGSGKSNFVDVLRLLADALTHGLDTAMVNRHGIEEMRRWSPSKPYDIALQVDFHGLDVSRRAPRRRELRVDAQYGFEVKSLRGGQYEVKREHLQLEAGGKAEYFLVEKGRVVRSSEDYLAGLRAEPSTLLAPVFRSRHSFYLFRGIRSFGFYSIFPNDLREPQKPSTERPLDGHGGNLSSVLRGMGKASSRFLPEVKTALGRVVPGIEDLQVRQVGGYLALKLLHKDGKGRRYWFDASQESDGTLRVLGVLTALYQDPPPGLIAIEEPELTVHPGMLALLRDCIVEAAEKRTQVIITTHSPELMSLFDVDVLRVVEMTDEGTRIGPVADWQKKVVHDELFLPGELVRIEGLQMQPAGE